MDNIFFDNRVVRGIEHDTQRMSPLWPHADQNKFIEGGDFPIWQGVLYLWPATPETSATVVWPGSHKAVYEALMASRDWKRSGHYCMLPKQQLADFAQHARRVPVPPGAMLLWSSRCIHQGWPVGPRLAVPLCFEPKFRRPAKAVSTKVELVRKGTPSTHWASICSPHTLGGKIRNRTELEGEPLIRVQHGAHRFMFGSSQADIPSDIFGLF